MAKIRTEKKGDITNKTYTLRWREGTRTMVEEILENLAPNERTAFILDSIVQRVERERVEGVLEKLNSKFERFFSQASPVYVPQDGAHENTGREDPFNYFEDIF